MVSGEVVGELSRLAHTDHEQAGRHRVEGAGVTYARDVERALKATQNIKAAAALRLINQEQTVRVPWFELRAAPHPSALLVGAVV